MGHLCRLHCLPICTICIAVDICNDTYVQARKHWQIISSPNQPGEYGNKLNCGLHIQANPTKRIKLQVLTFDTEGVYDWVGVYNSEYGQELAFLTGEKGRRSFGSSSGSIETCKSMGNTMYLHFHSDDSKTKKGFSFRFKTVNTRKNEIWQKITTTVNNNNSKCEKLPNI